MTGFAGNPTSPISALPPPQNCRGCTSMHFGENQLSPGSVSFSLLPTGHPRIFHDPPVRTSSGFYPTFILPMGSSPGFGSTAPDFRPIRTRFRFGSASTGLTSPGTVTPRLINQKAHRHPLGLRLLVGTQFQVSFTPLPGCFSPFPHGTGCAIGRQVVFSLGGWSPLIHAGFLESRATRDHSHSYALRFAYGALTLSGQPSQTVRLHNASERAQPSCVPRPQPHGWFRLLPFRSPLLRESRLISFPPGTEMFHFPGSRALSGARGFPRAGCPIRESWDQRPLAAPPGFSQLATPFFASCRLGIHCVPLLPSPYPMHFSMTLPHWWRQGDSNP